MKKEYATGICDECGQGAFLIKRGSRYLCEDCAGVKIPEPEQITPEKAAEYYCSTGDRGLDAYLDASPEWKAAFRKYVDEFRTEQRPQYDSFDHFQNKEQER